MKAPPTGGAFFVAAEALPSAGYQVNAFETPDRALRVDQAPVACISSNSLPISLRAAAASR